MQLSCRQLSYWPISYSIIFVTTPEPTVLPPSRMENLNDSSMAIGAINSTVKDEAYSMLLGLMKAPIEKAVSLMNEIPTKFVRVVNAQKDTQEEVS